MTKKYYQLFGNQANIIPSTLFWYTEIVIIVQNHRWHSTTKMLIYKHGPLIILIVKMIVTENRKQNY